MANYTTDEIVGKELFPIVIASVYGSIYGKPFGTIKPGNSAGIVYSWVKDKDGGLWWQFYDKNKKPYYIKHRTGLFDVSALKTSGAKTVEEKEKEEKQKQLFENDKLSYYIQRYGSYLLGTAILVAIIKTAKK